MKPLDWAERRLKWLAVPHVTLFLVFFQSLTFVLTLARGDGYYQKLLYIPDAVRAGEWWRLITFIVTPPQTNLLFAFFALYFFYLMGTALEGYWGTFRYNLFLLIGYLSALAGAWVEPSVPATTAFIGGSVFLAFAWLYPDFVIYIFFILPVKIKWLALLTWIFFGYKMVFGDWSERVLAMASVANFLLFFGKPLLLRARQGKRHMAEQAEAMAKRGKPMHVCAVCGATEQTHKMMVFRYCPDCAGTPAYCEDHIVNHTHIKSAS